MSKCNVFSKFKYFRLVPRSVMSNFNGNFSFHWMRLTKCSSVMNDFLSKYENQSKIKTLMKSWNLKSGWQIFDILKNTNGRTRWVYSVSWTWRGSSRKSEVKYDEQVIFAVQFLVKLINLVKWKAIQNKGKLI